jgi:hypothetical protein
VAFVGAGFSAPAVPTWEELLKLLGEEVQSFDAKNQVNELLGKTGELGLFDREAAAQIIEEDLGVKFSAKLESAMVSNNVDGMKLVEERSKLLNSIPFQSIVTTNFDSHLVGTSFSDTDIHELLRPSGTGWAEGTDWEDRKHTRPVVKIHGDIASFVKNNAKDDPLVFSRSGYRRLLFEVPNYQAVVRALLATRTILFIGFSFSDAYLNLLRSETLSMFGNKYKGEDSPDPAAYAIVNDLSCAQSKYLKQQEGIETIRYDSNTPPDHAKFDSLLTDLADKTSADKVAAELLSGQNILWFDPCPENNVKARKILEPRITDGGELKTVTEIPHAKKLLGSKKYHLLITHWGHQKPMVQNSSPDSNAQILLRHIRHEGIETPVIVFASHEHVNENRREAFKLGAFDFLFDWKPLFLSIERLFGEINLTDPTV